MIINLLLLLLLFFFLFTSPLLLEGVEWGRGRKRGFRIQIEAAERSFHPTKERLKGSAGSAGVRRGGSGWPITSQRTRGIVTNHRISKGAITKKNTPTRHTASRGEYIGWGVRRGYEAEVGGRPGCIKSTEGCDWRIGSIKSGLYVAAIRHSSSLLFCRLFIHFFLHVVLYLFI